METTTKYRLLIDYKSHDTIGFYFPTNNGLKTFLRKKENKHLSKEKLKIVHSKKEMDVYFRQYEVTKVYNGDELYREHKKEKFKKCVLCDKKVNSGQKCGICENKLKELNMYLTEEIKLIKYPLSLRSCSIIREKFCPKQKDLFVFIKESPNICFNVIYGMDKTERKIEKASFNHKRFENNIIDIDNIPQHILNFFRDTDIFEFLDIRGDEKNPEIFVKCLICNKEFWTPFSKIVNGGLGHQCTKNTSKGEYLVITYLKEKGFDLLTQRDTIPCINPKTGYVLPYDVQINSTNKNSKYKGIIIEVQGDQHKHFVKLFHSSQEAFEYQQYKDAIKKEYAINNNYLFVEIFYDEINKGVYKDVLVDKLKRIE